MKTAKLTWAKLTWALILFISVGVGCYAQTSWSFSLVLDSIPGRDTVLQPSPGILDISGSGWSATVSTEDADTSFVINFGGSNYKTNTATPFYAFEPFTSDVLPYTFYPDSCQVITNQDTTIQHSFLSGSTAYGFRVPQVYVNNPDSATGTIDGVMNFFKF